MSDGESPAPGARRRPTYGLPAPSSAPQEPSAGGSPYGAAPTYGDPVTGPLPASPYGPVPGGPAPAARRRRGLVPLVIGLVLLVLVAPAVTIGGLVWGLSSLVGDTRTGPTVLEGGSGEVPIGANEMLILYVPAEDAATTQCTAEGEDAGALTTVPTSGEVTFGDGTAYVQTLGVVAVQDTTATISCTGTDAPAHLGPYSMFGIAAPMVIGPILGVVAGLVGLALTVVGIVLMVRSRRS